MGQRLTTISPSTRGGAHRLGGGKKDRGGGVGIERLGKKKKKGVLGRYFLGPGPVVVVLEEKS